MGIKDRLRRLEDGLPREFCEERHCVTKFVKTNNKTIYHPDGRVEHVRVDPEIELPPLCETCPYADNLEAPPRIIEIWLSMRAGDDY